MMTYSEAPNDAKYLLLDSRIVSRSEGVRYALGTVEKDEHNPLFAEDKPWEPRFDNLYANILFNEKEQTYKCWYSPFIIDERTSCTQREKRASIPKANIAVIFVQILPATGDDYLVSSLVFTAF